MYALIGLIALFHLMDSSESTCVLQGTLENLMQIRTFGSKQFVDEHPAYIRGEPGETVTLFCSNRIGIEIYYAGTIYQNNIVNLNCHQNGKFYINEDDRVENIFCDDNHKFTMFESRASLPNCEKHMTYVVGRNFYDFGSSKYLAICYDIDNQQLKYISYIASSQMNQIINNTQIGQLNTLGLDINVGYTQYLFKTPNSENIQNFSTKYRELFPEDTYQYANLIQDKSLTEMVKEYEDMISVMWLRILLTGNWQNWLNALYQATKRGHKFNIQVGVSGVTKLNNSNNQTLKLDFDDDNWLLVPEIIWAYVNEILPTNLTINDIVIVGYNNPFIPIDDKNQLCKSMCNEVSWLKNSIFANLQLSSSFGLVHCCRVEDVETKLDNFPLIKPQNLILGNTIIES